VIVPVKNGEDKIGSLLDSLTQVDYNKDKLEVIVVDGNSTDGTQEMVSQYPVSLLTEERRGLNAARNTGIKHSEGEIIVFTDSDCVASKDWIRKIVDDFREKEVGCVGGNALGYYDDFLSQYSDESIMPVMRIFKKKQVLSEVKPPLQYPAGCNMAVRREVLERVGFFDESIEYGFDEDELVERICKGGYKMVLDPGVLVKHKHRSSVSELLRQNFRYGRGIGIVLKVKGLGSAFSRWLLLCIAGLAVWTAIMLSLVILTVFTWSVYYLATLLVFLALPLFGLIVFYAHKPLAKKSLRKITEYPFIDVARSTSFVFGGIYQLLKPRRRASR
jgi:cellulose synthase/poly-beta-1,6-N-acetylglucosamine synthase-like glycosyltransferase